MASKRPRTLLEPGHEADWAKLNAEKRSLLTPPPETPVEELLRRGQQLSAQAARLLRAVERADERPRILSQSAKGSPTPPPSRDGCRLRPQGATNRMGATGMWSTAGTR